jgi:dehydrogenase/reductase SDR family protein 4
MKRLQSKVAIVTASTRGIGFEIARRLCSEGASVVISSRKQDAVQAAVDTLRKQGLVVEGTSCHVGNAADRQKLLDFTLSKFGRYQSSLP